MAATPPPPPTQATPQVREERREGVDHEELLGEIEEGEEHRLERELFGESEEESEGRRERARLAKEQEEKREREEEERARRILDEARREREQQARKRQEQIATPAKRAKLAVKAEEAGLHPPRKVEKEVPLQKGTVSEDKKASLLVIAESRRKLEAWQKAKQARQLEEERVHRARMESIAEKAEKEAAKRKLDAEQSRQLAEERKAQLSPKGKGRKAVVSPPKQPQREHIPPRDSPEFVRYVERKVDALVAAVQAAPGIGWEAGDPLPPNAHEARRVLRDLLGAVNRFPDSELMLVSRQRSAMIPGLRFTLQTVLNMLDAALEIMRRENRSIEYDAAPNRKQIMDLVEKIRQDAEKREAARKEQEVRDSIKRQAMEKRRQRQQLEEERRKQSREREREQAKERQLKSLEGGTAARKKRRTKEGLASPGAEPGSPSSSSTTSSPTSPDYSPTPSPSPSPPRGRTPSPPSDPGSPSLQRRQKTGTPPERRPERASRTPQARSPPEEGEVTELSRRRQQANSPIRSYRDVLLSSWWDRVHPHPDRYMPKGDPMPRFMFVSGDFHDRMLGKVPFRADAVAETVMQFLGEHDKWEAAQIAVVGGHVTLEWEGQVYELPTPQQLGEWTDDLHVAPIGPWYDSDPRRVAKRAAAGRLQRMLRHQTGTQLVLITLSHMCREADPEERQTLRTCIALAMCMWLNFLEHEQQARRQEESSRISLSALVRQRRSGVGSASQSELRERPSQRTPRASEATRSGAGTSRQPPSRPSEREQREREEGEIDKRTMKIVQKEIEKFREQWLLQPHTSTRRVQLKGVPDSFFKWCRDTGRDPDAMVPVPAHGPQRPKDTATKSVPHFSEGTQAWSVYFQLEWMRIFEKAGELARRTDWACDELWARIPGTAKSSIAMGCLTDEEANQLKNLDATVGFRKFHDFKSRANFLDYMYYVMEARDPDAADAQQRQAVQWLQDPTCFKANAGLTRSQLQAHWNLLMSKAGEAKSRVDFRTLVEKSVEAFRRYPALYEQVRFQDRNLHVTWTDNWPRDEDAMGMAHRWHECRKWITSRLASIRPEDLQSEGAQPEESATPLAPPAKKQRQQWQQQQQLQPQPPSSSSSSSNSNNRNSLPEAKPPARKTKGASGSNSSSRCRMTSRKQSDRRGKRIEFCTSFPTPCEQRSGTSTTCASSAEEGTELRCAPTSSIGPLEDCMRWRRAEGE
jgi:hypothetical protein